jgi:hypothetical protein
MKHDQRHQAKRREVPGSIPGEVLGSFQATCYFCSLSFALGYNRPVTEMSTKILPWRISAVGPDSSAIPVCAKYGITELRAKFHRQMCLRDFYGKPLPSTWSRYARCTLLRELAT